MPAGRAEKPRTSYASTVPSAPLTHNKLECGSWRAIVAGPASSGSDALIVAVERSTIESAALPSERTLTASVDDDCDDIETAAGNAG